MSSDTLDHWRSHQTLGKVMLRALAEVPDLLLDPLPPLDEILQLGNERWGRDWPVESVEGLRDGQRVTLDDVPSALVSALRRDADRLGVTTGELTVLLLSAATYRTAMPCRHDAQDAWLNPPPAFSDYPDAYDQRYGNAASSTEPGNDPGKTDRSDDCEDSDDFEEVWIDDLPDAVLELKRPPE
jgi:hypothetical protein